MYKHLYISNSIQPCQQSQSCELGTAATKYTLPAKLVHELVEHVVKNFNILINRFLSLPKHYKS